MKAINAAIVILALLMFSGVTLSANACSTHLLSLPSTQVQLTVVNGTASYFNSTLSGVPAGFDVHNGVYRGWCVDTSVIMIRGVPHNVTLYSSLQPPSALSSINWTAINYILNHKQGSMMDVQQAIWHFSDAFSPISATAQAMVNAANAHPSYDAAKGAILAVICLRQSSSGVQNTIIEVCRCPRLSHGCWKHNHQVCNGGAGAFGLHSCQSPTNISGQPTNCSTTDSCQLPYCNSRTATTHKRSNNP